SAAIGDPRLATALLGHFFADAFLALAPLVAAMMLSGVAASLAMSGGKPNLAALKPKFERVSPKAGIKRLVSKQLLRELGKQATKIALVAFVAAGAWQAGYAKLISGHGALTTSIATVGGSVAGMIRRVAM